jgi:hypothetical protein
VPSDERTGDLVSDVQALHQSQPEQEKFSRAAASKLICDQPLIGGEDYFIEYYGTKGEAIHSPMSDDLLGMLDKMRGLRRSCRLYRRMTHEGGTRDMLLVTRMLT